jgi:hypothetical protein
MEQNFKMPMVSALEVLESIKDSLKNTDNLSSKIKNENGASEVRNSMIINTDALKEEKLIDEFNMENTIKIKPINAKPKLGNLINIHSPEDNKGSNRNSKITEKKTILVSTDKYNMSVETKIPKVNFNYKPKENGVAINNNIEILSSAKKNSLTKIKPVNEILTDISKSISTKNSQGKKFNYSNTVTNKTNGINNINPNSVLNIKGTSTTVFKSTNTLIKGIGVLSATNKTFKTKDSLASQSQRTTDKFSKYFPPK